jgi:hypothetical protein
MPDSGVEIKKEDVETLLAPAFFKVIAVGTTEHEQRGRGIPIKAALIIPQGELLPKLFFTLAIGTAVFITPASSRPKRKKGADKAI